MKRVTAWILIGLLATGPLQAQEYKVTTDRTDSFSVSLVKLLHAAVNRFEDCRGNLIQRTWIGEDYELTIPFPGNPTSIVRYDDWIKEAYIEYRGFADEKSREQGMWDLVAKIKNALGDQLYDPYENKRDKEIMYYGLSIKDSKGVFSMNMEIYGGSTSADSYVMGTDREDETKPQQNYLLLKIYPGIPYYFYDIRPVAAPDMILDSTIRRLLLLAESDFEALPVRKMDTSIPKRKGMDTIMVNRTDVFMNYMGARYSANLKFPAETDSALFNRQWLYYQQVLQAAIGNGAYLLYSLDGQPYINFYPRTYIGTKPEVTLELEKGRDNRLFINIKIESGISYPTKCGWNPDD
jgi:hypothetical protein